MTKMDSQPIDSFYSYNDLYLREQLPGISPLSTQSTPSPDLPRQRMEDRLIDADTKKLCAEAMRYSPLAVAAIRMNGANSPTPDVAISDEEMRLIQALVLDRNVHSKDLALELQQRGSTPTDGSRLSLSDAEEVAYMVMVHALLHRIM